MLEVRDGQLGKAIFADQEIEAGRLILISEGVPMSHRTRHTLQVDFRAHTDFPEPLRLINHSCDPNCGLVLRRGSTVAGAYALRPIAAGEELRTDYCTFENEIHFLTGPCLCGEAICRGRLTGFRDLSPDRIAHYGPYIAEYLQPVGAVSAAG